MGFYDEMASTAAGLLGEFKQGVVSLKRLVNSAASAQTPWKKGEAQDPEIYSLNAVARRLHQRYENGVLIVETGDMVIFAVPEVVPLVTDKLVLDGVDRTITNLTPIPPLGTTVAYKAWCKA